MGKPKNRKTQLTAKTADKHILYEHAVQSIDSNLEFMVKTFEEYTGRPMEDLREDFCGTACLSSAWVDRSENNKAWGIDLDPEPLKWCRENHIPNMKSSDRLSLIEGDVLEPRSEKVDMIAAFNFSYFIFKDRPTLRSYFEATRSGLKDDGMLLLDIFGGTSSIDIAFEEQYVDPSKRYDGTRLGGYFYQWDQEKFNTITNEILCHIHFRFDDDSKLKKAFTYDWRMWSIPEVKELLLEAGYKSVDVFIHGWDDDGEGNDDFEKRTFYENQEGWIGFVVARM